jgi:hypothetical protein
MTPENRERVDYTDSGYPQVEGQQVEGIYEFHHEATEQQV